MLQVSPEQGTVGTAVAQAQPIFTHRAHFTYSMTEDGGSERTESSKRDMTRRKGLEARKFRSCSKNEAKEQKAVPKVRSTVVKPTVLAAIHGRQRIGFEACLGLAARPDAGRRGKKGSSQAAKEKNESDAEQPSLSSVWRLQPAPVRPRAGLEKLLASDWLKLLRQLSPDLRISHPQAFVTRI